MEESVSNDTGEALARVHYLKRLVDNEESMRVNPESMRVSGTHLDTYRVSGTHLDTHPRVEDRFARRPSCSEPAPAAFNFSLLVVPHQPPRDEALLEEGSSRRKRHRSRKMTPFGTGKDRYRRKDNNKEATVWPDVCTGPDAAFSRHTCNIS